MDLGNLKNKTFLVIGGSPKEVLDGVRHYANDARPEEHGHKVAAALADAGAHVILLTPRTHVTPPANVEAIHVKAGPEENATAADMLAAAQEVLRQRQVDAVLQLANISSLRPAEISDTKLKVKKEAGSAVPMKVVGNVDVAAHLCAAVGTVAGYDNFQHFFAQGDNELCHALRPLIETAKQPAENHAANAPQLAALPGGKLAGRNIVLTSGPTVETLTEGGDIITNFSSGDQGFAVAAALAKMGAKVTLISGPTHLPDPTHPNITTIRTRSATEMRNAVERHLPADAYIGVAAVADFGLPATEALKLQEGQAHTLMLSQNPDILHSVGTHAQRPGAVIGFAAENHDLLKYGSGKLMRKGADAMCANPVDKESRHRIGKGNNQITWITHTNDVMPSEIEPEGVATPSAPGRYIRIDDQAVAQVWPVMSKADVGERIGDKIAALLLKQRAASHGTTAAGGVPGAH